MLKKIFLWIFINVSLNSFYESRLMKSYVHKNNSIKMLLNFILWFFIKIQKITGLFWTLMRYGPGLILTESVFMNFHKIWAYVGSWNNTHETFIDWPQITFLLNRINMIWYLYRLYCTKPKVKNWNMKLKFVYWCKKINFQNGVTCHHPGLPTSSITSAKVNLDGIVKKKVKMEYALTKKYYTRHQCNWYFINRFIL